MAGALPPDAVGEMTGMARPKDLVAVDAHADDVGDFYFVQAESALAARRF
jgi:hypothetical protein